MGTWVSKQPNGLYCRFSTVVDCPTNWNMTKEEYIEMVLKQTREELEESFDRCLRPFDWVKDNFYPNNMSEEKFAQFLNEVSEVKEKNMDKDTPMYDYEDCIEYIRSRCDLSEDVVDLVLELELDYMRSIGLVYEIEE